MIFVFFKIQLFGSTRFHRNTIFIPSLLLHNLMKTKTYDPRNEVKGFTCQIQWIQLLLLKNTHTSLSKMFDTV